MAVFLQCDLVESQCATGECHVSYFNEGLTFDPDQQCYADGTTVTLSCPGNIGGPTSNQCSSGSWILPSATCEVFTCAPPTVGEDVTYSPVKTTYEAREMLTYSCVPGKALLGASAATCDSQDSWNPSTVPTCTVQCDVPDINNGEFEGGGGTFNDGDTATVSCDPGFNLAAGSSSSITCNSDGRWSDIPTCYADCNVTGTPNSDLLSDFSMSHGEIITINCSPGYSYNQKTSFEIGCDDGTVTDEVPTQCFQDCLQLAAPTNGKVTDNTLHGETATYSCNRGYLFNETETATCNDGAWSNTDTPTCYKKSFENSIVLFCEPDKLIVEIPLELLEDDADVNSVQLGTCPGSVVDSEYLYANTSYTDCGTTVEVDAASRTVIYRNELTSVQTGVVTTTQGIHLNLKCVFDQDNTVSSSAVVQETLNRDLTEDGQYELSFRIFTDDTFTTEITGMEVTETNTDLVVLAEVIGVEILDVFPIRCYATPEETLEFIFYELIENGCSKSEYATDLSTSEAAVSNPHFAFDTKAFRFTASDSDSSYFHCDLRICPAGDCPLPSSCDSRRKRSTRSSLIVSRHVSAGPIRFQYSGADESSSSAWQMTALTVYSVSLSFLVFSVVAAVVIYKARAGYKPVPNDNI